MISIELRPELADRLQAEAARQQTTLQDLVNEWLAQDLWEQRNEKIRAEAEKYRAQHATLRAQFADKFIAMRGGQVVDSSDEMLQLYRRISERFGDEPVLITQVLDEPIESYTIHSPQLVTE